MLSELHQALNWVISNHPDEAVTIITLVTSPLIVPLVKLVHSGETTVLKLFKLKVTLSSNDIKRMIALITATGAMAVNYLLKDPTIGPQVIIVQGILLHTFNQPYYKLIIKPLVSKLSKAWADAIALNEKKTATLPAALAESTPFAE